MLSDKVKIHVENLRKNFGNLEVLKDINLDVKEGEVVCIIGPSGSGKSTFLRCLNLLEEPTGGEIIFEGKNITDKKVNINKLREKMGMVFQQFNLLETKTVYENIALPLVLNHVPKDQIKKKVQEVLEYVELTDKKDVYPSKLSGGQKQRVGIARALASNAKILLMDEPFGALDAQTRTQLQTELLKTWESERKTCFFITHDVDEAIILAQKVIVMSARPGRIKEIVDIDIPYPRDQETKMSPRFMELKNYIWSQVYQEYLEVRK